MVASHIHLRLLAHLDLKTLAAALFLHPQPTKDTRDSSISIRPVPSRRMLANPHPDLTPQTLELVDNRDMV